MSKEEAFEKEYGYKLVPLDVSPEQDFFLGYDAGRREAMAEVEKEFQRMIENKEIDRGRVAVFKILLAWVRARKEEV